MRSLIFSEHERFQSRNSVRAGGDIYLSEEKGKALAIPIGHSIRNPGAKKKKKKF